MNCSHPRRAAACIVLTLSMVAAGCTPTYDWRQVSSLEGGYTVMLPAKPTLDERTLDIAGHAMKMRMQAATANDALFAVGVVALPSDDPRLQAEVLAYLQAGLARNLGAQPDLHPVRIQTSNPSAPTEGVAMDIAGEAVGEHRAHRMIHARFVARGRRVYQAAVIVDQNLPAEQIDEFFNSWKVE